MREIETDYLVVGAGASGMAFVDSLIANDPDADVVMVDRRSRPGGHWVDAYPFVRIHQTSVNYGVDSRLLSEERIDTIGPNAGFYPRATGPEIAGYFQQVLDYDLLPTGRVRFYAMSEYKGREGDDHVFVSLVTGRSTSVKVRRRLVDATYVESSVPSKHTPGFEIDADVTFITPNDLVDRDGSANRYTVLGSGKTSMDTCNWLIEQGVAPDRIRWIKPREGWFFDRGHMQPLELVGSFMQFQAKWVRAAAEAQSGEEFALRMEDAGAFVRVDGSVDPTMFRGAIVSEAEVASLRSIEDVVRLGHVRRITTGGIALEDGTIEGRPDDIYVDCTAAGIRTTVPRPIFEPDLITLQYVTIGIVPWGVATVSVVEALRDDDEHKNALCPPLEFTGRTADLLELAYVGMSGIAARGGEPDIAAWQDASRLNPARGATDHLDDPRVAEAFGVMAAHFGPAMENLQKLVGAKATV